ncbi:hypothetical protein FHS16_005688 [Paenibacillus endophyticus]|uniref:Uncharacterized protein n=1 Tax=Paenibacillus endophyticus TaxID=1294268 RepID=A0A7W5CE51_9BACL|nr:hypothetical protein [Paenibacillus endophyticus]
MVIELDGFFENSFLIGNTCSITDLSNKYRIAKNQCTNMSEFTDVFCRLFQFERVPSSHLESVRSDIVIDIDTDYIYAPS